MDMTRHVSVREGAYGVHTYVCVSPMRPTADQQLITPHAQAGCSKMARVCGLFLRGYAGGLVLCLRLSAAPLERLW